MLRHTSWLPLLAMAASALAGPAERTKPLTPNQRAELEMLKSQLAEPDRTAKTKRDAATLLLTRTYPQAAAALAEFLADAGNRDAQVAIAEAVATSGVTRPEFRQPLMVMLTGDEPAARAPAANALAAFKDEKVLTEFIRLVTSRKTDRDVRLAIITAMQRVLDKQGIDALVKLVGDRDEDISNAACDALAKLTNIRAFGRDPRRWKSWWAENKDKPRSEWLVDLADSLSRANLDLERANAELRRRLGTAMNELYAATPPAGRDALLAELLKDTVGEVRLAAVRLLRVRLTTGQRPGEPLITQLRSRVTDPVDAVRREATLLLPTAAPAQAAAILTARLEAEQASEVRQALYQALGLLGDAVVWDLLVGGVAKEDRRVAAAAAAALARVAERNGLDDARRAAAADALKKRYAAAGANSTQLREALLTAVGAVKDKRLSDLLTGALKDAAATIRLSAVKGLQKLGLAANASAVAALAGDSDRGVRLAAITALGALGGSEHVEAVLARTDARLETDARVRQEAYTIAMGLLAKADTARLKALAGRLAQRDDARGFLIELLKLWAAKIPADKPDQWSPVRLRLGQVLVAADRPAEAAGELAAVHAALVKAGSKDAATVWLQWMEALLAADDASAPTRIAEAGDDAQFAAACKALDARVQALRAKKDWDNLVRLASASIQKLGGRLSDPARKQGLTVALAEARKQQRLADRQRVAGLIAPLTGADPAARQAAEKQLLAMKTRAAAPLAEELRKVVAAEAPDGEAEAAILKVLTQLAPGLTGYDTAAPPAQRLAKIDQWLKQLSS